MIYKFHKVSWALARAQDTGIDEPLPQVENGLVANCRVRIAGCIRTTRRSWRRKSWISRSLCRRTTRSLKSRWRLKRCLRVRMIWTWRRGRKQFEQVVQLFASFASPVRQSIWLRMWQKTCARQCKAVYSSDVCHLMGMKHLLAK